MATKTAPDRRHETLREIATGVIRTGVHPIDAREMIACGSYEYVTEEPAVEAAGAPGVAGSAASKGDEPPADPEPLPKVAQLPGVLAGMTEVAAIRAMKERDQRATAQTLYDARLAELEPPTS